MNKSLGVAGPLSLALFGLILFAIDLSGVHPGLPGKRGADQIRQMALQETSWRQVHAAFTVAGFLGLGGVLWLRRFLLQGARRELVEPATWVAVVGTVVFTATVLAEIGMIPDLAVACSRSPGCLTGENALFTEAFADVGWRVLPGLGYGARTMMAGLMALAVIGLGTKLLLLREGLPIALGAAWELAISTGLHGWGRFTLETGMTGLAAVLVVGGSLAILVRGLKGPDNAEGQEPDKSSSIGAAPIVPERPPGL